jgi:hypothetical protein
VAFFQVAGFPGIILRPDYNCPIAPIVLVLWGLDPDYSPIMWLAAATREIASTLEAGTYV